MQLLSIPNDMIIEIFLFSLEYDSPLLSYDSMRIIRSICSKTACIMRDQSFQRAIMKLFCGHAITVNETSFPCSISPRNFERAGRRESTDGASSLGAKSHPVTASEMGVTTSEIERQPSVPTLN